ncbi:MAG: Holliday junction resolvase RuvX [Opitutales bacterium]|nr:Holliday junction resolvase RuvX [Opitutales bacterium]
MNILGIDYGHKRIGLAYADSDIGVAVPIAAANESLYEDRLKRIAEEIKLRRIDKIVVGYPLNMDGSVSQKAKEVDGFIAELSKIFNFEIVRVDERLSSYQAESDMLAFSPKKTKTVAARKKNRKTGEVDSRASAIFLQEYLDTGECISI